MLHRFKLLAISTAIPVFLTLHGCVINPGNSPGNSYNHQNQNSGQDLKNILVYDLKDKNAYYAENELRNRGYQEYGRDGSHSWWFNEDKNQCYEFEEENNKVHKIHLKNAKDCNNAPGNNYNRHSQSYDQRNSYNNSQNYNNGNNSRYSNNGGNFGQTPNALSDLVGARAGQAEGELSRRGYQYTHGSNSNYGITNFWRESNSGACVSIVTNDGRYQSIVYTAANACN